jgi:hypothetical protein
MYVLSYKLFVPDRLFQPSLILVRLEPSQIQNLSGAPLQGKLLALSANIRLVWKGLLETNTLAYYEES